MGALTHNGEVLQSLPANASQINFDNTGTNLNSTQTENAIKEVNTKANTLQSEKADTDMVASDFSTAVSYTAGNYCIYEGKFYKFKNNHSGAWSAADVDEIKIAGELSSVKSGLTGVTNVDISAITLETGIAWNTSKSSYLKKRCGQLYGNLFFNGLLDMSASPFKKIGVISSPYIPIADSRMPVYLQTDSDIVIGVLVIFAVTGNIFVIAPKGNYGKSDGTGANSWCTSDGVYINMLVTN